MTTYHITDANDDEPGFIAARPVRPRPLTYRGFEIYFDPPPIPTRACDWHFVHKDYDGAEDANDNRCGSGPSFKDCVEQINDHFDDEGPEPVYKIGDGLGGTTTVRGDEYLFAVAEELGDGYCDECELPIDVCACEDAYGYDNEFDDRPSDFSATYYRPVVSGIKWHIVLPIALAVDALAALAIALLTGWRF